MKRKKTPKPAYWAGVLLLGLGLGALAGMVARRVQDTKRTKELLNQRVETFVLYNHIDPSERNGTYTVGSHDLLEYTSDFIPVMQEDQKLTSADNNVILSIPDLDIEAPVLDGIDEYTLSIAAGHFPDTGDVGVGNYCIAGHSSTVYKCIFNNLKNVKLGTQMNLIDTNGVCYTYFVTENKVVEPKDVWVLDNYGDKRLTLITCTDGGIRRQVVVGMLMTAEEYEEYCRSMQVIKRMEIVEQANRYGDIRIAEYLEEVSK